jgi:hypothetical protein
MDWATLFCSNPHCTDTTWMVKQDSEHPDLWWLAHTPAESPYMVAAVDPACPRCGTTLATLLESEGQPPEPVAIEFYAERSLVS